jgi:hypothetical protein
MVVPYKNLYAFITTVLGLASTLLCNLYRNNELSEGAAKAAYTFRGNDGRAPIHRLLMDGMKPARFAKSHACRLPSPEVFYLISAVYRYPP